MKTEWDYTNLAQGYLKRPDYAPDALRRIFQLAGLRADDRVCDIGAGVAHLTIPLAEFGCRVDAVEPNDTMRALGQRRTAQFPGVSWYEGTGEETGRPAGAYDFVSFGSSFNVCDRARALVETHRLLKPGKWFVCLWNHRKLTDPVQQAIENIIKTAIPGYDYGTRREDQTEIIRASGLFTDITPLKGEVSHVQTPAEIVEAWRSHSTLHRQAGENFDSIIVEIERHIRGLGKTEIVVPYTTHAWMARRAGRQDSGDGGQGEGMR